jgi:hypothetical protein
VAYVHAFARNLHGSQDLIKQLPSPTDKWAACSVLVLAGAFANDHQFRVWVAFTHHHVVAGWGQLTCCALQTIRTQVIQARVRHTGSLAGPGTFENQMGWMSTS